MFPVCVCTRLIQQVMIMNDILKSSKKGLPQGSILAPLLFNFYYMHNLPYTISRKFFFMLTILHCYTLIETGKTWERTLSQDMTKLSAFLQTWRLKLSYAKTVTGAFHLNNREAKLDQKVYNNDRLLPFCLKPTYLGVTLDRLLTFRHHLAALRQKLPSHVTLLRRLAGSGCQTCTELLYIWFTQHLTTAN